MKFGRMLSIGMFVSSRIINKSGRRSGWTIIGNPPGGLFDFISANIMTINTEKIDN